MSEPVELVRSQFDFDKKETTYRVRDGRDRDWNIIATGPITFKKVTKKSVSSGELNEGGDDIMRDAYMIERENVVATAAVWHAVGAGKR